MSDVVHDTFILTRSYPKPVETVFSAFSDPARKRRWFGHRAEAFELDFRIGGAEISRSRLGDDTPFPGAPLVAEGRHLDIVPNARIVIAATMDLADRRISAALYTFEFRRAAEGTELVFTHQAAFFEGADGPQMRRGGWEALLDGLAQGLAA